MSIVVSELSEKQKAVLQKLLERTEPLTVGLIQVVMSHVQRGGSQRTLTDALSLSARE
jgi:hypothetical protein